MAARRRRPHWPRWWGWPLELSPHVERRMEDRGFTEVELRAMIDKASSWRASAVAGRVVVASALAGRSWEIVVEPDPEVERLVVVTAWQREER